MNLQPLISLVSVLVALGAIFFTWLMWLKTNRPVVTAFVEETKGNITTAFELVISNTGNRPAKNVKLRATQDALKALVLPDAPETRKAEIFAIFTEHHDVAILRNGEELRTAFGWVTGEGSPDAWLDHGAQIEITVAYDDLDSNKFKNAQPLKIFSRDGFGGASWIVRKPD